MKAEYIMWKLELNFCVKQQDNYNSIDCAPSGCIKENKTTPQYNEKTSLDEEKQQHNK